MSPRGRLATRLTEFTAGCPAHHNPTCQETDISSAAPFLSMDFSLVRLPSPKALGYAVVTAASAAAVGYAAVSIWSSSRRTIRKTELHGGMLVAEVLKAHGAIAGVDGTMLMLHYT
jgi:hypothetical protein